MRLTLFYTQFDTFITLSTLVIIGAGYIV